MGFGLSVGGQFKSPKPRRNTLLSIKKHGLVPKQPDVFKKTQARVERKAFRGRTRNIKPAYVPKLKSYTPTQRKAAINLQLKTLHDRRTAKERALEGGNKDVEKFIRSGTKRQKQAARQLAALMISRQQSSDANTGRHYAHNLGYTKSLSRGQALKANELRLGNEEEASPGPKRSPKIVAEGLSKIPGGKTVLKEAGIARKNLSEAGGAGLKILSWTASPVKATSGATDAFITGKGLKGAKQAVVKASSGENTSTYSDVLKHLGVKNKAVRAVGGFGLDVALDPTTYATFGATAVAKKAGEEAAAKTAAKLAKAQSGLQKLEKATGRISTAQTRQGKELERALGKATKRAGGELPEKRAAQIKQQIEERFPTESSLPEKARARAEGAAPQNKGVTAGLRFGKHHVQTSGKTTAALSRATKLDKNLTRVRETKTVQSVGTKLRPDFRPKDISKKDWQTYRNAELKARAESSAGASKAQNRAIGYAKNLSPKHYEAVIDAIETGKISKLEPGLRDIAKKLRDDFRHMNRVERAQGIAAKPLKNYFPHVARYEAEPLPLLPDARNVAKQALQKGREAKLGSSKGRKVEGTLKEISQRDPSLFTEKVPLVFGMRASKSARGVADAKFLNKVASLGRPLTKKSEWDTLKEAVYEVSPTGLKKLESSGKTNLKEIQNALDKGGRYVILNKDVADRVTKSMGAVKRGVYDRAQGKIKTALTVPNPQYHFTNAYGDTFNAFLGDAGARSVAQGVRASNQARKIAKAERNLEAVPKSKALKIAGKKVSYNDIVKEAEQYGAINSGFIGRELPDLKGEMKQLVGKTGQGRVRGKLGRAANKARPLQAANRFGTHRENATRLGSFIAARKRGLSPRDAAKWANEHHFDYGDLTDFEQNLRRAVPFYTFTARNAPLQAKKLLTRPGKFATLEKARLESAKASGIDPEYEKKLAEYDKRGLPVPLPIKVGGQPLMLFPKLPASDLNRLSLNPKDQALQLASQVSPLVKIPVELYSGQNLFFREPIKNKQQPLVAAPESVKKLPKAVQEKLGVATYIDKKSGKRVLGWSPYADYFAKQLPETSFISQMNTKGTDRQGKDKLLNAISYASGLKTKPFDPQKFAMNKAFTDRDKIDEQLNKLRQQGIKKGSRYERLSAQRKKLDAQIYQMKKNRGYATLPKTGKPKSLDKQIQDQVYGDVNKLYKDAYSNDDVDKIYKEVYGQ